MKCLGTFLLILSSALVMAPQASLAQSPSTVSTTTPGSLGVQFKPGETVRYTFSLKTNLTTWVSPKATSETVQTFTPRQYQVEGEIVATFAATQPGEPLHGAVQFQGLTVKNWVSAANAAACEAPLRQLEATSLSLTTASDGNLKLAEMAASPLNDACLIDFNDLRSLAQALFKSRISSQSLVRGEKRESADFPIPGVIRPGIKVTTLTEYVTDVVIARHSSAEIRLSVKIPDQSQVVPTKSSTAQVLDRLHGDGVWTYLLDLDSHQISFLHKTIRVESSFSVESRDSNAAVRIPLKLGTTKKEDEVTARRTAASASPEREADLAAFEKSLAAAPPAAAEGTGPVAATSTGAEVSLGEVARRLRAERAAQGPARPEFTLAGGGTASEGAPVGFKEESLPNGDMSVFVPAEAAEESDRTSNVVHLHAFLNKQRAILTMSLGEVGPGRIDSPDHALDAIVQGLRAKGFKVGWSERKNINGKPGIVFQLPQELEGKAFLELQANVISGSKAFVATCGTMAEDFPNVESICRTVVESIRVRQAETPFTASSAAAGGTPTGFQQVAFPSGEMTVLVPAQASEEKRTSDDVELGGYLGTPPAATGIDLRETKIRSGGNPDELLDRLAQWLSTNQEIRAVRSEKTNINGHPALVVELLRVQGKPMRALQAHVLSGDKAFVLTCGAPPDDFAKVESLCRTVVNSIRAR